MSILTDLAEKKITWSQAAHEVEQWAQNLVAHDPVLTQAAGALMSEVKQGASNALMLADTALGPLIMPAAKVVETELEAALAAATKGATVVLNPAISATIDAMALTLKSAVDAWSMKAKASLTTAQPTEQPAA